MHNINFHQALYSFGLAFIPMMFGIICHEVAHGYAAYRLGDPTAKAMGRLTLNPIKHIDPMGMTMFVVTAISSPFVFGWAKPVPIQPRFFKNPRKDEMIVSFAGPFTNILVAVFFVIIAKILVSSVGTYDQLSPVLTFAIKSAVFGVQINIMLAIFNLMPIPPLDGSHIVAGFLPPQLVRSYTSIGRYGFLILIVLLASGLLSRVIMPIVVSVSEFIFTVAGLR